MGHNINVVNGKAAIFTVKEKAWHGLGQTVENAPNSEEAIKLAGLDWKVGKEPAYIILADGTKKQIPGSYSTVREDTMEPLGGVGSRYTPLQNAEAFDFFDSIVGKGEAIYETAGALGNGERIFITAKLPAHISVGKDDLIEQYLFFLNSHDGGALQAMFTPIRVVCQNTVNAALGQNSNRIRIGHKSNVAQKVKEAHKLMGIVSNLGKELGDIFNAMAKKGIVDAKLKEFIEATLATPEYLNKIAAKDEKGERAKVKFDELVGEVLRYAFESDTQQTDVTRGTVYGAYNAITGYFQNVKEYRNGNESKLLSLMEGDAQEFGQKAFNLALELVNN